MSTEAKRTVIRAPPERSLESDVQVLQYAPGSQPSAVLAGKPASNGAFTLHAADGARYHAVSTYRRANRGPLSRTTWFVLTPQTVGEGDTELQAAPVDEMFSVRRDVASEVSFLAPQEAVLDAHAKRASRAFKFDGEAEVDTELYAEAPAEAASGDATAPAVRARGKKDVRAGTTVPMPPSAPATKAHRSEVGPSGTAAATPASARGTPLPPKASGPPSAVPTVRAAPPQTPPAASPVSGSPIPTPPVAAATVAAPADLDGKVLAFVDSRRGGAPCSLAEALGAIIKSLADFEQYGGHADATVKRAWFNTCKEHTTRGLEMLGCAIANKAVNFPAA